MSSKLAVHTIAAILTVTLACTRQIAQETKPSSGSNSATQWTKFQDPFERAFTEDVPQGWIAKGGLYRIGYSDIRPMLDMQSPDGAIGIRIGDVAIPIYAPPDRLHAEGKLNDLGAQAQGRFARYRTGKEFAALYAQSRFQSICQTLTLRKVEARFPLPVNVTLWNPAGHPSDGEAAFECQTSQGPRIAYVFARTENTPQLWKASVLLSYIAPADREALTRSILFHSLQSARYDPQWQQYAKQLDEMGLQYQILRQRQRRAEMSQRMMQFEAKMQAMQNQVNAFERGQQARQAQFQAFDNALVGITPTVDPLTGEHRDVSTGPKSGYWTNGLGQTRNSNTPPGPGWHPLTPRQ